MGGIDVSASGPSSSAVWRLAPRLRTCFLPTAKHPAGILSLGLLQSSQRPSFYLANSRSRDIEVHADLRQGQTQVSIQAKAHA
jgi:hypothetical protein